MAKKKSSKKGSSDLSGTLNPIQGMQSLPQMVDTGNPLQDVNTNLGTLKEGYHPGTLPLFQQVMAGIAERTYANRQSSEMGTISGIMDPSKVSGGTFSNVLGWLEKNRGVDISRTYQSSMNAYTSSQETLSKEIQFLENMRQDMETDIRKFKTDLITNFPGVYEGLSEKEKKDIDFGNTPKSLYQKMDSWAKDVYDRKLRWEEEDRSMDRAMQEVDKQLKLAQTDDIKTDIAEKKNISLDFIEDFSGFKQDLIKLRDKGNYTALYNTVDDYNEVVTRLEAEYGKRLSKETLESAKDSLMLSLSPEDRASINRTTGEETFESKMNYDQQKRELEAQRIVDLYSQYGDLQTVSNLEEKNKFPKGTAKKYQNALEDLYKIN